MTKKLKRRFIAAWGLVCLLLSVSSGASERFPISAALETSPSSGAILKVAVEIRPGLKLYADEFRLELSPPADIAPLSIAPVKYEQDPFGGGSRPVNASSFTNLYRIANPPDGLLELTVHFQGCDRDSCFLPDSRRFILRDGKAAEPAADAAASQRRAAESSSVGRAIAGTRAGFMDSASFISFLADPAGDSAGSGFIGKAWKSGLAWLAMLAVLAGGLALNLTPCVLPLIPVNLAVIGAGVRACSPALGLARGSIYGLGIALSYGALGVLSLLTGSQFGVINASPWFNLVIAAVFLVLGLAMLDVFVIDLSKLQSGVQVKGQGPWVIFLLGIISAVLAGACVAPVVIAVLVLAADLYARGQPAGLLLPFLLGCGMALPWPLAGAGLSFLPKPGKWMARVKYIFAAVILAAAFYYGATGVRLAYERHTDRKKAAHAGGAAWTAVEPGELPGFIAKADRPVLVYFWATWCKSCKAMSASTFRDDAVLQAMKAYRPVKVQADDPRDPVTARILRDFGVIGFPAFVVVNPPATADVPGEGR